MSDLIDRQAAIDICRAPHMRNADCSDFEMAIMMLPPAQVTVKNCRDCTINIYPSQTRFVEAERSEE